MKPRPLTRRGFLRSSALALAALLALLVAHAAAYLLLCEDAIRWADEGHPVSSFEYHVNVWGLEFITYYPEGRDFYMPGGYLTPVGDRFGSKAMAATLRKVAEEGTDWMITGGWADVPGR